MNIQFNAEQLKVGNERREALHKSKNPMGMNQNKKIKVTGLPDAVKIDDSLLEIMEMKQHFLRELTNDAESKTFDRLHSEILENYSGEERDKRLAALDIAQQITEKRETAALNPFEAFKNFEERKAWLEQLLTEQAAKDSYWDSRRDALGARHYLDPNMCQIRMNGNDNGLILTFSGMLFMAMMNNGIESSMALFEKIRTDLMENFTGDEDELKARLWALEQGFLKAGEQYAEFVAGFTMVMSPNYTRTIDESTLTPRQAATNARIGKEAANLTAHISNMFRAALDFFKATGSFVGFMDSAEANKPGMLSLRDTELLFPSVSNVNANYSHNAIINTQGLSSSGKNYLQGFFRIA
jgi:hypothetical protein